jgi:DNA-binding HxlR family transcriptional regulator
MTEPTIASPLGEATARVGDRWTLLLVQALLDGPRRFNQLLEALPGIAPNVLSQRLKHLEREHVVVSQPYSRRPPPAAPPSRPAGTARPAPARSTTTTPAT